MVKAKKRAKQKPKGGTSAAQAEARKVLFVEAMMANGGNQTQAAISAGYSKGSAHVRGAELVKDSKVIKMLAERRAEVLAKAKLTSDEVLVSLARAVRFDPRKLFDDNGNMRPVAELDDDTALAIDSIEEEEIFSGTGKQRTLVGFTKKIKATSRATARDQAMKHFGLFKSDNDQLAKAIARAIVVPQKRPAGDGSG